MYDALSTGYHTAPSVDNTIFIEINAPTQKMQTGRTLACSSQASRDDGSTHGIKIRDSAFRIQPNIFYHAKQCEINADMVDVMVVCTHSVSVLVSTHSM